MKRLFFVVMMLVVCVCSCDTTDVITNIAIVNDDPYIEINTDFIGRFAKTKLKVDLSLKDQNAVIDSMVLCLNEFPIRKIEHLPWSETVNVGMLNDGLYQLRVKYLANGIWRDIYIGDFSVGLDYYSKAYSNVTRGKVTAWIHAYYFSGEKKGVLNLSLYSNVYPPMSGISNVKIYKSGTLYADDVQLPYEGVINIEDQRKIDETIMIEWTEDTVQQVSFDVSMSRRKSAIVVQY